MDLAPPRPLELLHSPLPLISPFSRHRCSHSSHSNIGNDGYAITFANDKRFGLFSRHRCSHSSHSNIGNDGYAITFANDKRFGLVESSSRRRRAECYPHLVWHIFVAAVYGTFDGHKSWYFEYYSLKLP